MRAKLWTCILVVAATPAGAVPFHSARDSAPPPRPVLHISDFQNDVAGWHRWRQDKPLLGPMRAMPDPASGGVSLGPVHADSEMVNGRRRMRYSVDGLNVMGGAVSGSVDARHAEIFLHWNTQ